MSTLNDCHKELKNGVGKCSVPMWVCPGIPAGFCDREAYGNQKPFDRYRFANGSIGRIDGGYDGYVPALACPIHGGYEKKEILNLCTYCKKCIADCDGTPSFGTGKGNDNVYECDKFEETTPCQS